MQDPRPEELEGGGGGVLGPTLTSGLADAMPEDFGPADAGETGGPLSAPGRLPAGKPAVRHDDEVIRRGEP